MQQRQPNERGYGGRTKAIKFAAHSMGRISEMIEVDNGAVFSFNPAHKASCVCLSLCAK